MANPFTRMDVHLDWNSKVVVVYAPAYRPFWRAGAPEHRVIRPGTLRQILSEAGLSAEQLIALL